MKILVLAGGESSESEVSVRSGLAVAKALISLGHSVAIADPAYPESVKKARFLADFNKISRCFIASRKDKSDLSDFLRLISLAIKCDLVFPALHGGIGENGRLAACLDCFGIPYCGSPAEALALSMDKVKAKMIYEQSAIITPAYTLADKASKTVIRPPRLPCVIKPASGGSSIGVTLAKSECEIKNAIESAFDVCESVLLEECIFGREFSVSVLCDKAIAITEIIPKNSFFDYECKYQSGASREITPAPISRELTEKAKSIALRAHKALGLKNFSRTDMILKRGTSIFYALETNAIPGLTPTSILPEAAKTVGIGFEKLCELMLKS